MKPEELRFAKTHEWVSVESGDGEKTATVGLSQFAIQTLTDLVYLNLPKVGRQVRAEEPFGEVESVKAVSDLYSPVSGQIVAVNAALTEKLETLSGDPYGAGWLVKIRLDDPSELAKLLDYPAYQKQCEEESHE